MKKRWEVKIVPPRVPKICKRKISQLQKIKQLKRNMVCKYKSVLMYNEYNLYFNSFTKEYPLILSSLNLTRTRTLLDFGWKMDWSSQQISSFELIRDLLFFKSSNVKALRLKFFWALEAWSVEFQIFEFVEVYMGFLA